MRALSPDHPPAEHRSATDHLTDRLVVFGSGYRFGAAGWHWASVGGTREKPPIIATSASKMRTAANCSPLAATKTPSSRKTPAGPNEIAAFCPVRPNPAGSSGTA